MNSSSEAVLIAPAAAGKPDLDRQPGKVGRYAFLAVLAAGMLYTGFSVFSDISATGASLLPLLPYLLLGAALLIALGFEFVNGFHDTANAVATVIYTHSLPPHTAVIWSGLANFAGVVLSSGAVAFGIISLLPVELILQVGSSAGFAMVFALLIAAIIWNLGTWWLGLPASSSHTMIGSVIGVGVANALMHGRDGTSGVDWAQATKVGYSLLLSPVLGFFLAALLLLALRAVVKTPALYEEPKGNAPPPLPIRCLLILTCTGVSFAHGSNDGQKGMGLIMLILVGTAPISYALNRAMPADQFSGFAAAAQVTQAALSKAAPQAALIDPHRTLSDYIRTRQATPQLLPALATITGNIGLKVKGYSSFATVPTAYVANVRNEMYLASEAIRDIGKDSHIKLDAATRTQMQAFGKRLDGATKFIPLWVKIAVAIALGLGTMIGWKRIVVTVGEKIGKSHLTYAQGASAELVAALTIGAADMFGLPVSTTHVLTSGVAGTMAANKSGLQFSTIRNMIMAWVLTLPMAILLSGSLYWLFSRLF